VLLKKVKVSRIKIIILILTSLIALISFVVISLINGYKIYQGRISAKPDLTIIKVDNKNLLSPWTINLEVINFVKKEYLPVDIKNYKELLCQNLGVSDDKCVEHLFKDFKSPQVNSFIQIDSLLTDYFILTSYYKEQSSTLLQKLKVDLTQTDTIVLLLVYKKLAILLENSEKDLRNMEFADLSKTELIKVELAKLQEVYSYDFLTNYQENSKTNPGLKIFNRYFYFALNEQELSTYEILDIIKSQEIAPKIEGQLKNNFNVLYNNFLQVLFYYLDQDISSALLLNSAGFDEFHLERFLIQRVGLIYSLLISKILVELEARSESLSADDQLMVYMATLFNRDPNRFKQKVFHKINWVKYVYSINQEN
ncbi:hypothetical protein, partial [Psittacicella gerlachiana]